MWPLQFLGAEPLRSALQQRDCQKKSPAVVTLRQPGATGTEADSLVIAGQSLVAVRDWTFLLGPNVMAGLNALLLGTLM